MVPWALVYAVNILAIFVCSLYMFYALEGSYKTLGLIPLLMGALMSVGYTLVVFFIVEQKQVRRNSDFPTSIGTARAAPNGYAASGD